MQIHELTTTEKKARRVGRGGKRGTFSGRGTKGQKARSGRRIRPAMRDILKKIPKRRGRGKQSFKSFRERPVSLNLTVLEKQFSSGESVTPKILVEKHIIALHAKKLPKVKILGAGDITKKLSIEMCEVSKTAREKIEKAGGSVAS